MASVEPLPPHAVTSEQALLGAVLLNADAIDRARDHVQPEDFFEDVNRHIFEVMCQRRDAGEPIDLSLMKAVLGNADLGGLTVGAYLANIMLSATTVLGAPGYARLIPTAFALRMVHFGCIVFVSTFPRAVEGWTVFALPSPYDKMEWSIVMAVIGVAGIAPTVRRIFGK